MSSEFVNWLIDKEINEGVFGHWSYHLPKDKRQQMYDFYMLEYLLEPGIRMYLRPMDFGIDDPEAEKRANAPNDPRHAGDSARTVEDKYYYALYEVANTLLPALKQELLKTVMFSISAELRHLYDGGRNRPASELMQRVREALGEKEYKLAVEYTFELQKAGTEFKDLLPRPSLDPNFDASHSGYRTSYRALNRAMERTGATEEDAAKLARWLFANAKWGGSYGGPPWSQIANGWLLLNKSENPQQLIAHIDHVYDLQHNTDTVFNKVQKYAKDNGFAWVKQALDHKRDMVSPHEFIEFLSPTMRELALIGIKIKTGKTWGDFVKDWPEVVKKKAEVYNQNKELAYKKNVEAWKAANPGNSYNPYHAPKKISPEEYAKHHIPKFNTGAWTYSVYGLNKDFLNSKGIEKLKNNPQMPGVPSIPEPQPMQPPQMPGVPSIPEPQPMQPAPEPQKSVVDKLVDYFGSYITKAYDDLNDTPRDLRIARILLSIKANPGNFGYIKKMEALQAISKAKKLTLSEAAINSILQQYKNEQAVIAYYQHKNFAYPKNVLQPQEAFKVIGANFSTAPHAFLDANTQGKVETALASNQDSQAINLIKKTTLYPENAAKMVTAFVKLEMMYLGASFAGQKPPQPWHGLGGK